MNEQTAKLLQKVSEPLRDAPDIFFRRRSARVSFRAAAMPASMPSSAAAFAIAPDAVRCGSVRLGKVERMSRNSKPLHRRERPRSCCAAQCEYEFSP